MSDTPRTDAKLDIYRQWFDAVQDLSPEYLEPLDYQLAKQLYKELGRRVPKSILLQVDKAMKAGKFSDTPRTDCCCAEHHANYGRCLQCPIHGTPPPDGTQAQVEAQPVCACGDSFTADSVCINCVTSERSSFEAQVEALQREAERRYDVFIATSNELRESNDQIDTLRQLVKEAMEDHTNPNIGVYEASPCNWCERAKEATK